MIGHIGHEANVFISLSQVRILKPLLTVSFISGDISLMNNYDDLAPTVIRSGLKGNDLFNVYVWADQMCCD